MQMLCAAQEAPHSQRLQIKSYLSSDALVLCCPAKSFLCHVFLVCHQEVIDVELGGEVNMVFEISQTDSGDT